MIIGVDLKALNNSPGGIARYLRTILDKLQEIDTSNTYLLFQKQETGYGIKSANFKKITVKSALPGTIWLNFILPDYLKRHDVDVFWAPEQIGPVISATGAKLITTIHDFTSYQYPNSQVFSNLIIMRLLLKKTIKASSGIICVSEIIKKELLQHFKDIDESRVTAIPNGAPWAPDEVFNKKRDRDLIFVGSLQPRKNILTLIKAMEILDCKGINPELTIVGPKGWRNKKTKNYIQKSPVKDQINFKGFTNDETLKKMYRSAKALVYPSLYEGFGLPVLEAFAMGCPVLTSKGSAMEEVAGRAGEYFDPKSPESIAEKIEETITQKIDFQARHHEFGNRVLAYSWERSARQHLEAFYQAME